MEITAISTSTSPGAIPVATTATGTGPVALAQLPRLTSLRAFGALAVLFFHLSTWSVLALPLGVSGVGYVGVAFFFVLSGFVLAWGTRPGLPARTFYRRRFARIWPAHLTVLAAVALLPVVDGTRSWLVAAPSVLLVQSWAPSDTIAYGMNSVAWSLSCEVFFYACFPLAVLVLRRLPSSRRWALVALAFAAEVVVDLTHPGLAFRWPPLRLPEFLLGLAAGVSFRAGWRPRIPAALAVALVAVALALSVALPKPVGDVVVAIPFTVAMLSAARLDAEGARGWLRARWLVVAGEASFAFYLVHELVIVNLRHHLAVDPVVDALVIVVVAAAAAAALHLLVERPSNRLLRGSGRAPAPARSERAPLATARAVPTP